MRLKTAVFVVSILALVWLVLYIIIGWTREEQEQPSLKQFVYRWTDSLENGSVFFQEIVPTSTAKLDVLLLHGKRFTSDDWVRLKTLDVLSLHGYRAVALDLPGHGKSRYQLPALNNANVVEFLQAFIKKTGLYLPVVVSPSASGQYSLPYIASLKKHEQIQGFVGIALTGLSTLSLKDLRNFPRCLIVVGSEDRSRDAILTNKLQKTLPNCKTEVILGAGQVCYYEKPGVFHSSLLKFLNDLCRLKNRQNEFPGK